MKAEPGKIISVTYSLNANREGETPQHIETAGKDRPLTFLIGSGGMIPLFESNMVGLKTGDAFNFSIDAADGYGEIVNEALVDLPVDIFKIDGVLDMSVLKTGNIIPISDREGNRLDGKIISVNSETVSMDFNHPLAGHQLHFSGEVIEVRDASAEELSHGHAHTGEHGH